MMPGCCFLYLIDTSVFEEFVEFHNLAGVAFFLWASYQHHVVHEDFANLRKDRSGKSIVKPVSYLWLM